MRCASGNNQPPRTTCVHQDLLPSVVLESSGFDFIDEGTEDKPKKGYVARNPDSVLRLKINTTQPQSRSDQLVPVYIGYLKSYEHMGMARLSCTAGCSCEPKSVDAHNALKRSTVHLVVLNVSQAPECVISVTVQSETQSGENKFKISAVMMAGIGRNEKQAVKLEDGEWGIALHLNQTSQGERG